jgi:hypothetical protein
VTTLTAFASSETTVLMVVQASTLAAGQTIVIDLEQMTVTQVDTTWNTVTVARGVNGTRSSSYLRGRTDRGACPALPPWTGSS